MQAKMKRKFYFACVRHRTHEHHMGTRVWPCGISHIQAHLAPCRNQEGSEAVTRSLPPTTPSPPPYLVVKHRFKDVAGEIVRHGGTSGNVLQSFHFRD